MAGEENRIDLVRQQHLRVGELLTEPLRARITTYHTAGIRALLEFYDYTGELLGGGLDSSEGD